MIADKMDSIKTYSKMLTILKATHPPIAELVKYIIETDKANLEKLKAALEEYRRE
jgi:hypothetical protein